MFFTLVVLPFYKRFTCLIIILTNVDNLFDMQLPLVYKITSITMNLTSTLISLWSNLHRDVLTYRFTMS